MPASSAAWRATFMPAPACSTHPMTTSLTSALFTPARAIASRMTMAPRSTADKSLNTPPNDPIGVRHALRITVSKSFIPELYVLRSPHIFRRTHEFCATCRARLRDACVGAGERRRRSVAPRDDRRRRDQPAAGVGAADFSDGRRVLYTLSELGKWKDNKRVTSIWMV